VRAHVEELGFVAAHPAETRKLVGDGIKKATGKALPPAVLDMALGAVEPTSDPMPEVLTEMARRARRLRYLPEGDLSGLVDRSLLDAARSGAGAAP
jgi:NitT/TauT family transport system substrate-binding protein